MNKNFLSFQMLTKLCFVCFLSSYIIVIEGKIFAKMSNNLINTSMNSFCVIKK